MPSPWRRSSSGRSIWRRQEPSPPLTPPSNMYDHCPYFWSFKHRLADKCHIHRAFNNTLESAVWGKWTCLLFVSLRCKLLTDLCLVLKTNVFNHISRKTQKIVMMQKNHLEDKFALWLEFIYLFFCIDGETE